MPVDSHAHDYANDLMVYKHNLQIIWNWLVKTHAAPTQTDAIIIPGSLQTPSAEMAAKLFKMNCADIIVTTGGRYKPGTMELLNKFLDPKQPDQTEAKFFRDLVMQHGVPEQNILLEEKSTNLRENFTNANDILAQSSLDDDMAVAQDLISAHKSPQEKINIVCGPFLMTRAKATAQIIFGKPVEIVTSTFCTNLNDYMNIRNHLGEIIYPETDIQRLGGVCAGEILRLDTYGAKGDCAKVSIPSKVEKAALYVQEASGDQMRWIKPTL